MAVLVLLLFLAAVGTAREYTDHDRAQFPKLFHLDDYKRCLARQDGLYCLGTYDLTPAELPHPTYELMKAYSDESYRHFNRTRIHRGYCVSKRCPTKSPASLRFDHNASLLFEHCVDRYAKVSKLHASLKTLHYCRTHKDAITVKPQTTAEKIFMHVIYAVVIANVVGTFYDVYTGNSPNKNKLLSAFSIPENWRRLTVVHESGDPRQTALIPIQGLRIVALGFTTYAHSNAFHFMFHTTNPEFMEEFIQSLNGIYLTNGTSLIQAFLMMTCFLTGYNLLIFSQQRELSLSLLPLLIIKRAIRITPVHLLVVGFAATWWLKTRDGPLVSSTIGLESQACTTKFWSHAFFVNNIVDAKDYCIAPTWFLAANMHVYILACSLTLLLWRRRCTAVKLYLVLLAASCLLMGVVAYIKEYKSFVNFSSPEEIRIIFRDSPSFTDFYISSWAAMPACFLGLILAHIQFALDERKIKLSEYKWFVYLHYAIFPMVFTWALIGLFAKGQHSPLFHAAYIALDWPIYCIVVAITMLGLLNVDSPLRSFFSWRGWHSLAQMSLTVMMLHWCINMTIGARPVAYGSSILDIVVDWISTIVLTYAAAVPITILVETPMQRFLGALLF